MSKIHRANSEGTPLCGKDASDTTEVNDDVTCGSCHRSMWRSWGMEPPSTLSRKLGGRPKGSKNNPKDLFVDFNLQVDPDRLRPSYVDATSIYVRAQYEGKWGSHDIAVLDAVSLLRWIRSKRSDNNHFAEDIIGVILGHGHISKLDKEQS